MIAHPIHLSLHIHILNFEGPLLQSHHFHLLRIVVRPLCLFSQRLNILLDAFLHLSIVVGQLDLGLSFEHGLLLDLSFSHLVKL